MDIGGSGDWQKRVDANSFQASRPWIPIGIPSTMDSGYDSNHKCSDPLHGCPTQVVGHPLVFLGFSSCSFLSSLCPLARNSPSNCAGAKDLPCLAKEMPWEASLEPLSSRALGASVAACAAGSARSGLKWRGLPSLAAFFPSSGWFWGQKVWKGAATWLSRKWHEG